MDPVKIPAASVDEAARLASPGVDAPPTAGTLPEGIEARGSWRRQTFAALSSPDYRLFFMGMAVSSIGTWGRRAAQQWLVWDLTRDATWLSWVGAAGLLPVALVSLPAGALVDRVDKRKLLLWLQVVQMAIAAAFATLVALEMARPVHVVVVAALLGVATGIEMPCRQAFLVEMVGKDVLRNAIALNSIMFNLPLILGPWFASVLMEHRGPAAVFVCDALTFLASIYGFARMRVRPPQIELIAASAWRQLSAGVRYVGSSRPLRAILMLLAVAMVFGWSYTSLLAAYSQGVLHEGAREYGWLYSSSGVGACLGALWTAGRRGRHPAAVLVGGPAGLALSLAAMALWPSLPVAVVARAVAGFCMISFFANANSSIQMGVPDAIRGRVMALWTFTFGLSLPLGQLLLGAIARHFSVLVAFGAGATVVLAAAIVVGLRHPFREGFHPAR